MSPSVNEDARFPLSAMQDNVLLAGSEPPPPSLEHSAASKGEKTEADSSLALPPRAGAAVPAESRSPLTRLPENASSIGGGRPPSAELFFKGGGLDTELCEGSTTDTSSRSASPPAGPCLADLEEDASKLEELDPPFAEGPGQPEEAQTEAEVIEMSVDEDAESAIHALLALQREPSPPVASARASPELSHRRPPSPSMLSRQSAIGKAGCEASRFFCKFPRCGKAYASTDAVRKHCRQRHLDWLRRLGHGCPALYCTWED